MDGLMLNLGVCLLAKFGVDLNHHNNAGGLMMLLLDLGADPNMEDDQG